MHKHSRGRNCLDAKTPQKGTVSLPAHRTAPRLFSPHLTLLHLALPCLTLPYLTSPCHTLPYDTLRYLTLRYLAIPYLTLPYVTLPYLTLPYHTLPYLTLPYLILPYPTANLLYKTHGPKKRLSPKIAPIWAPAMISPYDAFAPSKSTVELVNAQNSATASEPYDSIATKDTQPTILAGFDSQLANPRGAVRRTKLTAKKRTV